MRSSAVSSLVGSKCHVVVAAVRQLERLRAYKVDVVCDTWVVAVHEIVAILVSEHPTADSFHVWILGKFIIRIESPAERMERPFRAGNRSLRRVAFSHAPKIS